MLKNYDADQVSISIGGHVVSGYADGEFVTVARDEDAYSLSVGADGEPTRSKSNNFAGTITLVLQQTSDSNDVLAAKAELDELSNGGLFPVSVKDNSGRAIYFADAMWVQKKPDAAYGRESGTREWVLRTGNLQHFAGGN